MSVSTVTGLFGMPGTGKSTIGRGVAREFDAVSLDNDIHGYPASQRIADAAKLGLANIDELSDAMAENSRRHAIAFEARVRDIASQGFNVVYQYPGENLGIRVDRGPSVIDDMRERFNLADCSFSPSYLVPLPGGLRSLVTDLQITPDQVEELLRSDDAFALLCNGLDERFRGRGLNANQRKLDEPKIGNPAFVRERLTRVAQSMRDSEVPGIPVFLDENLGESTARVCAVHRRWKA